MFSNAEDIYLTSKNRNCYYLTDIYKDGGVPRRFVRFLIFIDLESAYSSGVYNKFFITIKREKCVC